MFVFRLKWFFASVPLMGLLSLPLRADTIVFQEDFNGVPTSFGATTVGQFHTINGTNVDVVGPSNGYGFLCASPESGNCVDLGGSGGNAVGQLQLINPLNLAAGIYELQFELDGSGRGMNTSTTVAFGDYLHTFNLSSGDTSSGDISVLVNVAGGPTQLTFTNNGGVADPNVGALLDNVFIKSISVAPVPEPSSLLLLATGIAGAIGAIRRKLFA